MPTPQPSFHPHQRRAWRWPVALLTIGILWLAALGKAAQVITEAMMINRWFWTAVLEVELVLGLVLLLGRRSRRVWTSVAGFFIVLAMIAGWKGLRGDADCGCFGVVPMNPWITFVLDLVIAVLLLVFRPPAHMGGDRDSREKKAASAVPAWVGFVGTGLIGIAIVVTVAVSPPGTLRPDGIIDGSSEHVVLEPESWVGQPLPLLPYLPDDARFDEGTWKLVLARPGCPHCLDYLARWEPGPEAGHAAIVSLASPAEDLIESTNTLGIKVYTLDEDRRWYADVPITIQLNDGIVTRVSTSGSREKTTNRPTTSLSLLPDPDLADAVVFTDEGRVDLGYITPGSEHTLAYRLQATADQPLQILGIHSECKCTTVTQAPERIEAGEEAVIVMRFASTGKPLAYNQGVLIRTDHPNPDLAERRLAVTARIGLPLSVEPAQLTVGTGETPHSVTVTNDGLEPIRLIYAVAESPGVTAQVPREPIAPGGSVEVPVVIDRGRWDGRPTRLRIPTTDANQPDLFITVEP